MRRSTAVTASAALAVSSLLLPTAEAAPPVSPLAPVGASKDVAVSETGSYVVLLQDDAAAISVGREQLATAAGVAEMAELEQSHDQVLADHGLAGVEPTNEYTAVLNGFSARLDHAAAERLAADPRVAMVLPDYLRQPMSLTAGGNHGGKGASDPLVEFLGLTGKHGAYAKGITGEGVIVGVIDTGIWPENPMFADDGTLPPAPELDETERSACDFGNTAHHPADLPFECNDKLVGARQMLDAYRELLGAEEWEFDSARDENGHGTHTASTAAGNANVPAEIHGRVIDTASGVAPRAQIVAYKALGDIGGFTSDLAAAIDQAVVDGVDVINYSIGGGAGPLGADALAFLFAADAGVFVATSAGNSGPGAATIGSPAVIPWVTSVGASTQERFYAGTIRLGNGRRIRGASVTERLPRAGLVDAEDIEENPLCLEDVWDEDDVAGKIVLCQRGGNGRVAKGLAVMSAGGVGMILYNIDEPNQDNLFTDNHWLPTVHIDQVDGERIKAYIDRSSNPTAAIVSTARITRTPWRHPSMTVFSSRGPNPMYEDIVKPDVTAPGIQVLAAASPVTPPDSPDGHDFQAIAGTSMSSPVVAGLYALLKQAHPDWSPAAAKSALMTSAHQRVVDNDRETPADPFDFGAGHVDPGHVGERGSMFNPGVVYEAGFNEYLGFLCDADRSVFLDAAATCGALEAAGIPTRAADLNLASIGASAVAGSETVIRTITSVAHKTVTFHAKVRAPEGYDVTVDPSSVTLAPGESATVEITITNQGAAPSGEWRFGSLTWKGRGYEARSPIAVRGTLIEAEDAVSGTGAEGTADIPVQFGYTGTYVPEPSGLVASTPHTGDIGQDPDQSYPSPDDADGGVDLIPVELVDTAYARFELFMPGDDDIDLYLLDPAGELVAASTSAGTAELIELSYPASGTYTLVVHGWAVSAPPLEYSIDSWVVPSAPGNLTVTAAPPAAEIGVEGVVSVAWSGLTAPGRWFGAVAHTDGESVLDQTVVEVTVPPAAP